MFLLPCRYLRFLLYHVIFSIQGFFRKRDEVYHLEWMWLHSPSFMSRDDYYIKTV